jgi:TonB family protein
MDNAICHSMKFRLVALSAVIVTAWIWALRLPAQEVTVGEPGWFKTDGVPDVPPQPKRDLRVEYPDELSRRDTDETGYVILTRYLDAKGQSLMLEARSAYPWFKRAVEQALAGWSMRPAKRGGQPVPSWFWIPVIFNPRAAAADQPDATPRLLAVTPVIVPPAMMMKLRGNTTAWGTVSLNTAGVPEKVVLEPGPPDKLLPYIEAALKGWRFAPARKAGQPVAAEFRVAFLFYAPMAPVPTKQTPPRVVKQEPPIYPRAMRSSRIKGEVLLAFVVDDKGNVVNPVVVRSNNTAFDEAAIEAVLKWKFEPAVVEGHPVNTRMAVPIIFDFSDGSAREAVTVDTPGRKAQERLPEALRYDVAPKPRGMVQPVYPYPLLRDDRKGKATVVFVISQTGDVEGLKVIEATEPEFGLALTAAVETFKFEPALKDGHPTQASLKVEQEFNAFASGSLVADQELSLLRYEQKKPAAIVGADQLDLPLKPRSRRPPVFPLALRGETNQGQARIEFLVDEEGHARLPRIAEASDPAFGYAAVQAVSQWLFEPPKAGGKAVVVRVVMPFTFESRPPVMGTAVGEPPAAGDGK